MKMRIIREIRTRVCTVKETRRLSISGESYGILLCVKEMAILGIWRCVMTKGGTSPQRGFASDGFSRFA